MWRCGLSGSRRRTRIQQAGLLRVVRRALGVPVAEIAEKQGVAHSVVFALEISELECRITMDTLTRAADALGCKVVYGLVPGHGQTFEELAEERLLKKVLKSREGKEGHRDSGRRGLGT